MFSWCLKGPLKLAVIADMLNAQMAEPAMPFLNRERGELEHRRLGSERRLSLSLLDDSRNFANSLPTSSSRLVEQSNARTEKIRESLEEGYPEPIFSQLLRRTYTGVVKVA